MARKYGALSLGTLSTSAGLSGSWFEVPAKRNHTVAIVLSGSTAAITGNVALQGRVSTAGTAVTLASWSSTLGTGVAKNSTNSLGVNYVRLLSTGLASTASTGTVAIQATGYYLGV